MNLNRFELVCELPVFDKKGEKVEVKFEFEFELSIIKEKCRSIKYPMKFV